MADKGIGMMMIGLILASVSPAPLAEVMPPPEPSHSSVNSWAEGDRVAVEATITSPERAPSAEPAVPDPYVYERRSPCFPSDWTAGATPVCLGADLLGPAPDCGAETMVLPLWRQPRDSPLGTDWELVEPWHCPTDPAPVLTAHDFQELPLTPAAAQIQPAVGDLLVNLEVILHTDATEQAFTTTLLGQPLEVIATPQTYTWDFGDGTPPLVTTDPGRPYPAFDLTHVYREVGEHTITLSTTWTGRYRPTGATTWSTVVGTATTTATSRTFAVVEARTHLVAGTS